MILADDRQGPHNSVAIVLKSSSHSIENCVGQHTSLVDQGTVDSIVDHVLKFIRIGFKSDLSRRQQCFLLDYFAAPVDTEGLQTLLLVILHSFSNSLLLLISEIGFRHRDDVLEVEIGIQHVDLDLELVLLGVPKDVLVQKRIYKHKGLIPDSKVITRILWSRQQRCARMSRPRGIHAELENTPSLSRRIPKNT